MLWFVSLGLFSALGFALASYQATGNGALGFNVFIGVFCFITALCAGIRRAVAQALEGAS